MLFEKLENYSLVLGSGSPRRRQLLSEMGLTFTQRLRPIEESYPNNLYGKVISEHLAREKANALLPCQSDNEILITADTLVWFQNQALGKPKDIKEAFAMLQLLSGNCHEVITSVCFTGKRRQIVQSERTKVTFRPLTTAEINHYIDRYQPLDKAGSYGIQEWIGLVGVSEIRGSYTNVMGFPTEMVYQMLTTMAL